MDLPRYFLYQKNCFHSGLSFFVRVSLTANSSPLAIDHGYLDLYQLRRQNV